MKFINEYAGPIDDYFDKFRLQCEHRYFDAIIHDVNIVFEGVTFVKQEFNIPLQTFPWEIDKGFLHKTITFDDFPFISMLQS